MPTKIVSMGFAAAVLDACTVQPSGPSNDFVFLGESLTNGETAAQQANLIVRNANQAGCRGVSVGGYSATNIDIGQGQRVFGVPVLINCPDGVTLIPNGTAQP
ncbi:MAG: hypothetical protein AAFV19_02910 [Pseudomonadota bacterium]